MPTTTTHAIYYPSGTAVPNVPVQDQTQAESVEAALNKITKAPMVICEKTGTQLCSGTVGTYVDVIWQTEIVKQGITHAANSASFTVTESGVYQIIARGSFADPNATGTIVANINGVDKKTTLTDAKSDPSAYAKPEFSAVLKLTANDIVKIRAKGSLASLTMTGDECSFQLSKVVVY
jgi:hypothetical protein